ncbi:MAG TPA: hypothetical protein VML19_27790 [Verrucomicrobiae bacterium]|nr:hypothetical protein [Verrucomicrobiae bacterium]
MDTPTLIALVIAILAFCGIVFLLFERYRTRRLRSRFGPEFDRAVAQEGSVRRAKAVLDRRERRVAKYQLRELTEAERENLAAEWSTVQQRFVDDPNDAIERAERLVVRAMRLRGYPTTDFESQAADLSVSHPHVLTDYRIAHEIMIQTAGGKATTEDLRRAMQHYRNLFQDIASSGWIREEARLAS